MRYEIIFADDIASGGEVVRYKRPLV